MLIAMLTALQTAVQAAMGEFVIKVSITLAMIYQQMC